VISFAYDEDEPDAHKLPVHGDLVVSMDRVVEQAERFRVSEGAELARLVIHGTLHLCGYDHMELRERTEMREHEDRILAKAGKVVKQLEQAFGAPRRRPAVQAARKPAAKPARKPAAKRGAAATRRKPAVKSARKRSPVRKAARRKSAAKPARGKR
jgi:rRNA maturation RNase YbeY